MKKWILIGLLILPANILAVEFPQIEGWTPIGQVYIHQKDDLWQYIDGGAELFLSYGFQMLRFRDFSKGTMEMTVEIYDMATPLNAFGIYTAERGDEVKPLPIGTEAVVVPPDYCQLLRNRYYVKIKMHQGALDTQSGQAILGSVNAFLTGSSNYPKELKFLPVKDKITGSVKYVAKGYKGLGDLNRIIFADYRTNDGSDFRYFILLPSADETIDDIWQYLSGKWESIAEKGHTILYRDIPYEGKIGIVRKDKKILGVSGVSETKDIIKRLLNLH
jgi:hypothetical protein